MRRLFGRSPDQLAAQAVYTAVVERARTPIFYLDLAVPDTLDGRFEMIILHIFLVLHRLRSEPESKGFAQALYDALFADMDRALREMGTGDLSVSKQVKRMTTALAGRIAAYQAGLAGETDLGEALGRNLYGTVADAAPEQIAAMAAYLRTQEATLARQPTAAITAGTVDFAALPTLEISRS
jgi:cytochrome b pre-mRNA-processing protein 3